MGEGERSEDGEAVEAARAQPLDAVSVEDEAVEVVLRGEGAAADLVEQVAAEVEQLEGGERGEEALGQTGEPVQGSYEIYVVSDNCACFTG